VSDDDPFDALIAPVLDPAFRLAMTMLKDRTAAEDAVQEAAFKAWRNRGKLRPGSPLRPWLLAIVANECRTARRARWWKVIRGAEVVPRPASRDTSADRIDLEAALDRLPKHHLLVLSLYYHLDLPVDEVAQILGCSEGAVRQRIHRALAALRPTMALEADA
jgi:RNA polymerase sigma factor (sigma-70 family)